MNYCSVDALMAEACNVCFPVVQAPQSTVIGLVQDLKCLDGAAAICGDHAYRKIATFDFVILKSIYRYLDGLWSIST